MIFDGVLDQAYRRWHAETFLGLALELGLADKHREHGRHALGDVLAGDLPRPLDPRQFPVRA